MAIDAYLQIDGIKGESVNAKHIGWIARSSVHWEVTQAKSATSSTGGGHTAERADFSEIHFVKLADLKWQYTQQKIGGGVSGNTAGGWDLSSNRIV